MDHGHVGMQMPMTPDSMSTNSTSMMMNDMAMHMGFFWGKDVTILFDGWPGHRLGMYILSLIFVFILALAFEVLSYSPLPASSGGASPVLASLLVTVVYAVRMALAYMVMLAVMSFNVGIFIVAVAGHAVGCFLVKLRKNGSPDQHPKP